MQTETISEKQVNNSNNSSRLEFLESGIAVLYLGHSSERVITFTVERLSAIRESIQRLKQQKPPGLIIASPSREMFTAGADINLIKSVEDPKEGERLAAEGQAIFTEIEALTFPTVAAISGPCVGGGCELALACIGLPEVKLGILPGFGGTQRLPRLLGLPRALDIILGGKILRPKQALADGLVDDIVKYDNLIDRAAQIALHPDRVKRKKISLPHRILTNSSIGRNFIRKKTLAILNKQTKGFYPAPFAALESVLHGLQNGIKEGMKFEARELGRLIVTPESKSLVNVFFLSENSKNLGKSAKKAVQSINAMVVGAGIMGAGIAGILAKNEASVILKDNNDDSLKKGILHIKNYVSGLKYLSQAEQSFILNRIEGVTKDSANIGNLNFVIEAVFEDISLKIKILSEAANALQSDCILATNTSSLSVSEIASKIKNPERLVGMHFFNPVDKMPLVEIIRGKETSDKTVAIVAAMAVKIGKFPIIVEDVPGFLVNRILTPYLSEAAHLISEGYQVADIDRAAVLFGMPMGPVRLLDEIGLDVAANVSDIMAKAYGTRMQAPGYSKMLLNMGRKGKKTSAGFYDFTDKKALPNPTLREKLNLAAEAKTSVKPEYIQERLIFSLINEAVRCLDEGVAGTPGKEAAQQIDLGTVMGIGFPPFRGGLLHYANIIGVDYIYKKLLSLQQTYGERYKPAEGIKIRSEKGLTFY
mgnify:CR=1 FL=1